MPPERGLIIPAVAPRPAAASAAVVDAAVDDESSLGEKTFEATYESWLLSRRAVKRAVDCTRKQKRRHTQEKKSKNKGQRQRTDGGEEQRKVFNRAGQKVENECRP